MRGTRPMPCEETAELANTKGWLATSVWALLLSLALLAGAAPAAAQQSAAGGAEAALEAGEEEEVSGRTLADWYALGGFVMHGLVLLSVLSLALVIERLWSLRRNRVIPRKFMRQVMEHWRKSEVPQVLALCGAADNSIARVLRTGLIHFDEGLARVEDAVGVTVRLDPP